MGKQLHSRRDVLKLAGFTVATITVAGCGDSGSDESAASGSANGEPTSITMLQTSPGATFPWMAHYVAINAGYFKDEGLDVDYKYGQAPATTIAAVASRSVGIGFTGSTDPWTGAANGAPLRVIACEHNNIGQRMTASKKFLERAGVTRNDPLEARVKALEGATFGMASPGDTTDQMIKVTLAEFGVPADSVKLRPLGTPPNMISALQQNQVDVISMGVGNEAQAVAEGFGDVYLDGTEIPSLDGYPTIASVVNSADLRDDAKVQQMTAAVTAIARAMQLLRDDAAAAKPHVRKMFPKLTDDVFDASFETTRALIAPSPVVTREAFEVYASAARRVKAAVPAFEEAVDMRAAEAAVQATAS